jgi:hypothetical protein
MPSLLERFKSGGATEMLAASAELHDAVQWADGTEANRPCREVIGALGGVEEVCKLLVGGPHVRVEDEAAQEQHWATLGQLCLCPTNAARAADAGALAAARELLSATYASDKLRTVATLMISTFAGFCSTQSLREIVSADLLPVLIGTMTLPASKHTERDERDWSISSLAALSRNGALRSELLEAGLPEAFAVLLYTEGRRLGVDAELPSEAYLKGAFALACLVGQEENHAAIGKNLDRCIRWMVEDLQAALERRQWPESSQPVLWVVTHGIASMAIADSNKEKLGEAGVIPLLVRVLMEIDDASTEGAWAQENATAALWALAFSDGNKERLLRQQDELFPPLQRIGERATQFSSEGMGGGDWRCESILRASRSAANLKFKVESKDKHHERRSRPTFLNLRDESDLVTPGSGEQLMLSYSMDDSEASTRLQTLLTLHGYKVKMFNNQETAGDQIGRMTELVDTSDAIVVALSSGYRGSRACRMEYEYAHYEVGKPIILLQLESAWNPDGWLLELVGSQRWHNCSDEEEIQASTDALLRELSAKCRKSAVTMLALEEEAQVSKLLGRLKSTNATEVLEASRQIHNAAQWADGTEANRPCREAIGTLGGVEEVCKLLADHGADDEAVRVQHWATLGQLCLCPKNAASAARAGALEAARELLAGRSAGRTLRITVTLMLSTYAGFCSTNSLRAMVDADLLPLLTSAMMRPKASSEETRDERDWSISTLTALSRNGNLHEDLLEAGLADAFVLLLYTEGRKLGASAELPSEAYLKGAFGLACLVGQEENHAAIGKDLDRCIRWMVEDLQAALERRQWPESSRPTLWVVTHGIASMTIADSNKEKLGEAGVIPLLVRVLMEIDDASTEGAWAQENATAALFALTFSDGNREKLLAQSDELHEALQRMCERSCEHGSDRAELSHTVLASMRRTNADAGYLLFVLDMQGGEDEDEDEDASSESGHIMISYAEEQIDLARELYTQLKSAGHKAWLDVESKSNGATEKPTLIGGSHDNHRPGEQMKVLEEDEIRSSVFISHSRRDPAAINIAYCIIYALRYACDDDGSPICPQTYIPDGAEFALWLDKEQMADAGG